MTAPFQCPQCGARIQQSSDFWNRNSPIVDHLCLSHGVSPTGALLLVEKWFQVTDYDLKFAKLEVLEDLARVMCVHCESGETLIANGGGQQLYHDNSPGDLGGLSNTPLGFVYPCQASAVRWMQLRIAQ